MWLKNSWAANGHQESVGVQDKQLLAHSAKQLKFQFWKLPQFYLNYLLCQAANFENGCMTSYPICSEYSLHLIWTVVMGWGWRGSRLFAVCPRYCQRKMREREREREREHMYVTILVCPGKKEQSNRVKTVFQFPPLKNALLSELMHCCFYLKVCDNSYLLKWVWCASFQQKQWPGIIEK